ncbi:endonuclease/exonuclease/phosphatase family protein [Thalassococcus sp. S3]|uniref:endonuclease/exonuclease/phosphatase family protein n=1 Tax=Thalassococcus sp. S3 TaxID=2017482 RepID=UPI0010240930|nr:endonuclease/exonuclease/phosphatase family protein [Thalassococcus sp. S3]QBF30535.1 endonuclease [Thalassococcus sp. S3]
MTTFKEKLRCATWNVHRTRGRDGRVDPARIQQCIATRLAPLHPHVLALQEADAECRPHARLLDIDSIAEVTGLAYAHDTPDLRWGPQSDGFLGTILFLHPGLPRLHADVIDLPGHCHRGAIAVETLLENRPVRICSAHLSLSQALRIVQMRILGQYLRRRPAMQTIFLGDFNEWRPWGGAMFNRHVVGTKLEGPNPRTFPSHRPLFPLDRILTDAPGRVTETQVLTGADLVAASDHLPLFGVVALS